MSPLLQQVAKGPRESKAVVSTSDVNHRAVMLHPCHVLINWIHLVFGYSPSVLRTNLRESTKTSFLCFQVWSPEYKELLSSHSSLTACRCMLPTPQVHSRCEPRTQTSERRICHVLILVHQECQASCSKTHKRGLSLKIDLQSLPN